LKPYKKLVSTVDLPHEEWLGHRRMGIGGSDAGAVLGFNPYKGAFAVYQEKVNGYIDDLSSKESVYWGNVLEPVVIKEFEKRTGKKVQRVNAILQSVEYPHMLANLDGKIVGENAILECKTASSYLQDEWDGDEVPAHYICQCQHYMAVTGAGRVYIACLIGGQKFVYKFIERDQEFIDWLINQEGSFWKYVTDKNPPMPDGTTATAAYLAEAYPNSNGSELKVTQKIAEEMEKCRAEKEKMKTLKQSILKHENVVKAFLKDTETGISDKYRAIWKPYVVKRIDTGLLKDLYPEIYEECLCEKAIRKFEIKEI